MPGPYPDVSFLKDGIPLWRCPACHNASLKLVDDSFTDGISAATRNNQNECWFDVSDFEGVFTCMLQCTHKSCQEEVAVSGVGHGYVAVNADSEHYTTLYQARSFVPPIPVFMPPATCPEIIRDGLNLISMLLPVSGGAAVNAIRTLLEELLDELSVPRQSSEPSKKDRDLSLHCRIENYADKLGIHHDAFMALKWLGNAGSHKLKKLDKSDIWDACEVLEDLLNQIYVTRDDIKAKIARLHDNYAPGKNKNQS